MAYQGVRKTIATATTLRGVGLALGGLLALFGVVEIFDSGPSTTQALPAIIGGAIVASGAVVVHAVLVALGQTALAAIDTAVNTSPLLEPAEKAAILKAIFN
jgi:hypothetical protein